MQGTFKGWSRDRDGRQQNYGFISQDTEDADVFMHESELESSLPLSAGARLRFDVKETDRGLSAVNVQAILSETGALETERTLGKVTKWLEHLGYGFLDTKIGSVLAHSNALESPRKYLSLGEIVEFTPNRDQQGRVSGIAIEVVGWEAPETTAEDISALDRLEARLATIADMQNPKWIYDLEAAAEKEPWEYSNSESKTPLPILRNYFYHTFRRLQEMSDGIAKNENGMSFNTGLVSPHQEEIYAFFVPHSKPNRQPWQFAGFKKESDRQFMQAFGASTPPLAEYYKDPSELIYDRNRTLVIDKDHILETNIGRFPAELQTNRYIAGNLLDGAEARTKKRVYRNYKTAIPQYFRDRGNEGKIQLLLPICLQDPSKADLAVAVERQGEDAYRGSTVLTLDMAYNNARLLAKPDREWLEP